MNTKTQQDEHNLCILYVCVSSHSKFYVGITKNLEKRLKQHSTGIGAQFFRQYEYSSILFKQTFESRSLARREEIRVKKLSRAKKIALIQSPENEHIIRECDVQHLTV